MSGVGLYSVVEHEDNLLETLFEFGMTSMIYCNTVSQRNFISIHFHTCSSVDTLCLSIKVDILCLSIKVDILCLSIKVDILCLSIKVLYFLNQMRWLLVPVLPRKKE